MFHTNPSLYPEYYLKSLECKMKIDISKELAILESSLRCLTEHLDKLLWMKASRVVPSPSLVVKHHIKYTQINISSTSILG